MISHEFIFDREMKRASVWKLENDRLRLRLFDLGASILSLQYKDASSQWRELLRGQTEPRERLDSLPYHAAIVGRSANRTGEGRYEWQGKTYQLECNEGRHHLHGGSQGFHRQFWSGEARDGGVCFRLSSPAGSSGYPGTAEVSVLYRLLSDHELELTMRATCSEDCPINLTHHNYFNLDPDAETILDHSLRVHAQAYTPVDAKNIPCGSIEPLDGKILDFRNFRRLSECLEPLAPELAAAKGLDHNYVLSQAQIEHRAAELISEASSIGLAIRTDLPGLQIYSCNYPEAYRDFRGRLFARHYALCLEPQYFPDAVNHANFASPMLRKGEIYQKKICYDFFDVDKEIKQ